MKLSNLLAIAFVAIPISAEAQSLQFRAFWAGPTPQMVRVSIGDDVFELTADGAKRQFYGMVSATPELLNSRGMKEASLDAIYENRPSLSIPLRLTTSVSTANAWLSLPTEVVCMRSRVEYLERQIDGELRTIMATFIEAGVIYNMQTAESCGSQMLKRVAKLWFDASYALVKSRSYFRLDEGAKAAYRKVNPDYVTRFSNEDSALAIKTLNDQKRVKMTKKDFVGAASTNALIIQKLTEDPALARIALRKQGLSSDLLERDGEYLATIVKSSQ